MSDSSKTLTIDDSVRTKITNLGSLFKYLVYMIITTGIVLHLQNFSTGSTSQADAQLVISNCMVFVGTYLYFTISFYYNIGSKRDLITLGIILIIVAVAAGMTLTPQKKTNYRMITNTYGMSYSQSYVTHSIDQDQIIIIGLLSLPILIFLFIFVQKIFYK